MSIDNTSIFESDIKTKHNLTFEFTACCGADSKGCDGYIGCRSCHKVITDHYSDGQEKEFLSYCRPKEKNRFKREIKELQKENKMTKVYSYSFLKDESVGKMKCESWVNDIPNFDNRGGQALDKAQQHLNKFVKDNKLNSKKYRVAERVRYKYDRL